MGNGVRLVMAGFELMPFNWESPTLIASTGLEKSQFIINVLIDYSKINDQLGCLKPG